MISIIFIAISLGALYLVASVVMYDLGRKAGHNEATLDQMIKDIKMKPTNIKGNDEVIRIKVGNSKTKIITKRETERNTKDER